MNTIKCCDTCQNFITNGFDDYIDDCKIKKDLNKGDKGKCVNWEQSIYIINKLTSKFGATAQEAIKAFKALKKL